MYGKLQLHDGIAFKNNDRDCFVFLEYVIDHYIRSMLDNKMSILVYLWNETEPDLCNRFTIAEFGSYRHQYSVSSQFFIRTMLLQACCLIEAVMFVIHLYWVKQTHGLQKRFEYIAQEYQA